MEHLSDLLLRTCNPLTKAEYFGVIFDKVPTYQEIVDGTKNTSLVPDINQIFQLAFLPNNSLVRERGLEPPRLAAQAPHACVYASFTTRAYVVLPRNRTILAAKNKPWL